MLRLRELRKKAGLTMKELGAHLGVAESTVSQYETGKRQPDYDTLLKIAAYFHVSADYLLDPSVPDPASPTPARPGSAQPTPGNWVPVLGQVAAGIPIEAIEDILDYEEITAEMAGSGEHFALKVRGDSMEPRIMNGDVVIVRRQDDVDSGDTAVVLVNGGEATVKRVKKSPEGVILIPNNHAYEPMFYSNADIERLPVQILGKVVELRAKF